MLKANKVWAGKYVNKTMASVLLVRGEPKSMVARAPSEARKRKPAAISIAPNAVFPPETQINPLETAEMKEIIRQRE